MVERRIKEKATEELVVLERDLPNHHPSGGSVFPVPMRQTLNMSKDGAVRNCGLRLRDFEEF